METLVKNSIEYTYNQNELKNKIYNTINKIKVYVILNNYRVSKPLEQYLNLESRNLSKNQMKKIQKYCYWIENNPSLKRINTFLSLISRLYGVERVQLKISEKEEKIQIARKNWLEFRNEAERLLKIYKEEKGDFYKR